jgi:hypothetical protein
MAFQSHPLSNASLEISFACHIAIASRFSVASGTAWRSRSSITLVEPSAGREDSQFLDLRLDIALEVSSRCANDPDFSAPHR